MALNDPRRAACRAVTITAAALIALAGCASSTSSSSSKSASASSSSDSKATAVSDNTRPGSYSVINGEKSPIPAIAMGDARTVARIIDEGKNRNQVMDHLTHISTVIGPRLTGSTNAEVANKWCRDQFESWGLSIPAFGGAEGQTSTDKNMRGLWQWGQIATRFDRGPSSGKILSVRNPQSDSPEYNTVREMEFTSLSWAVGTPGAVRGQVLKFPENEKQFEAAKDKVKGSWVLVRPSQGRRGVVGGASARLQLFADIRKKWKTGETTEEKKAPVDPDMTHYEGTVSGSFARDGMPFTLDLKLTNPKAVTGSVSVGGFRLSEIQDGVYDEASKTVKFKTESPRGVQEYTLKLDGDSISGERELPDNGGTIKYSAKKAAPEEPAKGPTMEERVLALQPAGWILASSNELVLTSGAPGWDKIDPDTLNPDVIVTVRQSDYDCMNSRIADGNPVYAEFDLPNTFTKGPIPVYDTIAEIKGSQWPDEVIIVSGHLDSWNGPQSQGTTDNGTGSAVTLEAARLLAVSKAKPKRTIRFILWTGEEQGLLGSVAYVKYLKDHGELEKVSAVLVDDGGTNYEGGLSCVESQVPYLAAATAPVNGHFYSETDKKFLDVNVHKEKTFTQVMGSDHNSFMREHIPGFFWDEIGRADYNHTHHTQYDRIDQAIPEYLRQSATCAAVTAYNLACAPAKLDRPSEEEWPQGGRGGGGGGNRRRDQGSGGGQGAGGQGSGGQGSGGQGSGSQGARPGGGS